MASCSRLCRDRTGSRVAGDAKTSCMKPQVLLTLLLPSLALLPACDNHKDAAMGVNTPAGNAGSGSGNNSATAPNPGTGTEASPPPNGNQGKGQ